MKKILAIVMGVAFAFSTAGYAVAQAPPAAPKADEKKADDKKADKMDKKADKKGTEDTKAPAPEKK